MSITAPANGSVSADATLAAIRTSSTVQSVRARREILDSAQIQSDAIAGRTIQAATNAGLALAKQMSSQNAAA